MAILTKTPTTSVQPSSSNEAAKKSPSTNQVKLTKTVWLPSNEKNNVFLLLCANQAVLNLFEQSPSLMEDSLRHSLETTAPHQDIVIFLADGEIQEEFYMSSGNNGTPGRAKRMTALVAKKMRALIDDALTKINSDRIKAVVPWDEVASSSNFQQVLADVDRITNTDLTPSEIDSNDDLSTSVEIQNHVKTLVKSLASPMIQIADKKGATVSHIFKEGEDDSLKEGSRYLKRYNHLKRACILEVAALLVGLEYQNDSFTEMIFPATPGSVMGMSLFAECLEGIRKALASKSSSTSEVSPAMQEAASSSHGITFAEIPV